MTAEAPRPPVETPPPDSPMRPIAIKVLLVQVATLVALFLFESCFTR